jgi:hypothetical protein
MAHELAQVWNKTVNGKKVYYNKPSKVIKKMTLEQKRFFNKTYKTEKEADDAQQARSRRYKLRMRQRIKKN